MCVFFFKPPAAEPFPTTGITLSKGKGGKKGESGKEAEAEVGGWERQERQGGFATDQGHLTQADVAAFQTYQ